MPEHLHGKFVWFELKTRTPQHGRAFYTELLPWTTSEMPFPGGTYTMFHAGERPIGGIARIGDDMPGVPDHWLSWVSVADVDATCAKIAERGGKVVAGPMDMPDMMRMAFCVDPEGAPFAIMKGTSGDQPDVDSFPGIFYWNELYADDAGAEAAFYRDVLGYTVEEMSMGRGTYYVLNAGGKPRGGIMTKPVPEIPTMWLPYVHVADVDATIATAVQGGAALQNEIMDIPNIGRFGILLDPNGAAIALMTPAVKR